MISEIILLITEWIGTVSFAVSGALVAIKHNLDFFGVATVGAITAIGGGIMRDIMIGNTPPKIFSDPIILLVAIVTAIIVFLITYFNRKSFTKLNEAFDTVNVLFDALGLASFTIAGTEVACLNGLGSNVLLVIVLGVITGVGGGILRDVLVNEKPYILTKHVYAIVSIVGCCLYYFISVRLNYKVLATVLVLIFTVLIRLLAAKFRWKLPKIKIDENDT